MKRWLVGLALFAWSSSAAAQSPDDQALLDLAAPGADKPARKEAAAPASDGPSERDEAEPGNAQPGAAPIIRADAAELRRQRHEARQARRKQAKQAAGQAQTSAVRPQDADKMPAPAQEKSAATESAVETLASEPKIPAAAAREAKPRRLRPEAKLALERPARKKTAYDLARDKWHEPAPPEMCTQFQSTAIPDLVFQIQGKDLSYVLRPQGRNGGWDEAQLANAKEAFGSWPGGPTPHPRTLDLVYAASLHFGCPYVTLISGIRKDRGGSRHSHGLAADVVMPGVDDEELAAFFRAQGFVGVGTYPRAGFVHVDTRDQSFFWIDSSKPNQRGRVMQVRKEESLAVDEAARARGHGGFVNPPRLQKALRVRAVRKLKAHKAKLERTAAKRSAPAAP